MWRRKIPRLGVLAPRTARSGLLGSESCSSSLYSFTIISLLSLTMFISKLLVFSSIAPSGSSLEIFSRSSILRLYSLCQQNAKLFNSFAGVARPRFLCHESDFQTSPIPIITYISTRHCQIRAYLWSNYSLQHYNT